MEIVNIRLRELIALISIRTIFECVDISSVKVFGWLVPLQQKVGEIVIEKNLPSQKEDTW